MTDDLKNPLDAFLESEDTELFSDEAFTPQSKQINEAPQLSKPVEQQTENQEELKDVPNAATDQQTLFAEAFAQTPSAQAGADAADPLEAALKKAQAQSENRMIERLAEKNAVFCYANAKEEITDRDVTFEALREKYQSDFPELSDAKKVSWTVTYGKTTKNVQNPGSDKVYDIKSEIERSKPFIDGIKNAKKDEEKQPVCTVKPKVTAQQKGEINLSSYKDYCLLKSEALKSDKVISIVPSRSGVIYQLRKTDVGAFTAPAMDIAELDDIASGFEMHLPKIPAHILMQIINFFRKVADRSGCEALAHILYDKRRNLYTVNVPKQKVSACSVRCVTDKEYPDYLIHVMDIHSHNVMPAEFSETDDNDEKATRLYAVVGTLDKAMPEISVRASCAGYYIPVSAGDVFESDFKAYPCPGDWHNQLTVEHEPKHALELKNSDLLMPQRELV